MNDSGFFFMFIQTFDILIHGDDIMKILVIPTWYPNGKDQLMGIYHKEYCEALAKDKEIGINILFIETTRLSEPIKSITAKKWECIKEKNYNVYISRMINMAKINEKWQFKRYVKRVDKAFKRYLKTNPMPDILHAEVTIPAGYATCLIGKKYNIPVVVTEHASSFEKFFEGKYAKYSKFVLENAYFTTVSNYMLNKLPMNTTKKAVIPNLVDTDSFKLTRKKIEGLRIAYVCAFRKGKRVEDLLSALKIIVDEKKVNDVKLTIVGDGYLNEQYLDKCHELGIDNYVDFVGRKSKSEIAKILNQNNIFAIPSLMETFCIPGIEALASGMPIVSTKCCGPEEYVDEKCGKLVNIKNPKEMADAILEVYNNLYKYDINYLRSVADKYSAKNVCNIAKNIYKEILEEK